MQDVLDADLTGVIVEIVESQASDRVGLAEMISEFRRGGVLIAVDDTGSGYAGPARLSALRLDLVKIDQSLISGPHNSQVEQTVIEVLANYSRVTELPDP